MFGIDLIYIAILGVGALMSFVASMYVKSAFNAGAQIGLRSGLSLIHI
jgi:hypothetical protein